MNWKHLVIGTGTLLTLPITVPIAFASYLGYRVTRFAFRYPKTTVLAGAATWMLWYAAHNTEVTSTAKRVAENVHFTPKLEQRLQQSEQYRQRIANDLETQKTYIRQLEEKLQVESKIETPYSFYYVKLGDTMSKVAWLTTGSQEYASRLAQDNGITNPNAVVAGQLLRIPAGLCITGAPVHNRVPELRGFLIPGSKTISEALQLNQQQLAETLELNRHLGLFYSDAFPHPQGARIVYRR
jgi:hypothetical protein